jgi:hypothetical protein
MQEAMEFGVQKAQPILLSWKEFREPGNQLELPHAIDTRGSYLETSLSRILSEQAAGERDPP